MSHSNQDWEDDYASSSSDRRLDVANCNLFDRTEVVFTMDQYIRASNLKFFRIFSTSKSRENVQGGVPTRKRHLLHSSAVRYGEIFTHL